MHQQNIWDQARRRLVFAGIWLFLAGLLTGFVIPVMENPRVGLSSHLEGVINGIFLIGMGAVWPQLRLAGRTHSVALGLVIFAAIANWFATFLAGIWGTGTMMPIAAPGRAGAPLQEAVVSGLLVALSLAMVAACVMFIFGSKTEQQG